jgi:SAM-dependent methyltransferase
MLMKCPVCEYNSALTATFSFQTYKIYTCPECLTRFAHPFVNNEAIYNSSFIAAKTQYLDSTAMNTRVSDELRPFLILNRKKILDVGCGTGSFLKTLKESNDVLGIENSAAYNAILELNGIPHIIGELSDSLAGLPDCHFDLITLWDVFEHLDDPNGILGLIKRKLTSTGIIIIWTNNYDDSISSFAGAVYRLSFGRVNTLMQMSFNRAGGHNFNFVSGSLEKIYHKHGLRIIKTVITDTASDKLTKSFCFKVILEIFYAINRLRGKGKIICHVLTKDVS